MLRSWQLTTYSMVWEGALSKRTLVRHLVVPFALLSTYSQEPIRAGSLFMAETELVIELVHFGDDPSDPRRAELLCISLAKLTDETAIQALRTILMNI